MSFRFALGALCFGLSAASFACSGDDSEPVGPVASPIVDLTPPAPATSAIVAPPSTPATTKSPPRPPAPPLSSRLPLAPLLDEVIVMDADGGNRRVVATTPDEAVAVGFLRDGSVWYTLAEQDPSDAARRLTRLFVESGGRTEVLLERERAIYVEWAPSGMHAVVRGSFGDGVGYPAVMLDRRTRQTLPLGIASKHGLWFGDEGYLYSQWQPDDTFRLMFVRPGRAPEALLTDGAPLPSRGPPSLLASPDFAHVLVTVYTDGVWLLRISDRAVVRVSASDHATAGPFSPDSRYFLLGGDTEPFARPRALRYVVQDVRDGSRRPVFEGLWLSSAAWSPDGSQLAAVGWRLPIGQDGGEPAKGLHLLDTTTWTRRLLYGVEDLLGLRWFQDGNALLVWKGCIGCDGRPHGPAIVTLAGLVGDYPGGFWGSIGVGRSAVAWAGRSVMLGQSSGAASFLEGTPVPGPLEQWLYYGLATTPAADKVAFIRAYGSFSVGLEVNVTTGEYGRFEPSHSDSFGATAPISPDGSRSVAVEGAELVLREDDSDLARVRLPCRWREGCQSLGAIAWSPNNTYIAVSDPCASQVYILHFDARLLVPLVRGVEILWCGRGDLRWSDDVTVRLEMAPCGL